MLQWSNNIVQTTNTDNILYITVLYGHVTIFTTFKLKYCSWVCSDSAPGPGAPETWSLVTLALWSLVTIWRVFVVSAALTMLPAMYYV